jgi:acetylornithine deacetylase/succinyl-diaminopimelate desuccinylase-like protein
MRRLGFLVGLVLICHPVNLLADSAAIDRVAHEPKVRRALAFLDTHELQTGEFLTLIAAIESPSGHEQARVEAVARHMREIGLQNVSIDNAPNAVGIIPGRSPRALVFVSTLDDLPVVAVNQKAATQPPHVADGRVIGPGTNDVSIAAAMLAAAEAIMKSGIKPEYTLIFAGVAQEETGLKGMRELYAQYKDTAIAFVDMTSDGPYVFYGAMGIHWWKVVASGPGGHSLGGGLPSVNQAIARSVDRILSLEQDPAAHTVISVGMLQSGSVFNHKPETGWFSLDIRSKDNSTIEKIENDVRTILAQVSKETSISLSMEPVSSTPAGQIAGARDSTLVRTSEDIVKYLGLDPVLYDWGSANLNIAIANGTPAVAFAGERGGRGGFPDEWADIPKMTRAAKEIVLLAATMKPGADPGYHK